MKRLSWKTLTAAAAAGIVCCVTSCGKQTPEPPMVRSSLLLDIFASLDQQKYEDALAKTNRLRALDQTSVFLTEMGHVERANIYIVQARGRMEQGDYAGAENLLAQTIRRFGSTEALDTAYAQAAKLRKLDGLVETLSHPGKAEVIIQAAKELQQEARKKPKNAKLTAFAEQRLAYGQKLAKWERDRMRFSLYSECQDAARRNAPEQGVLEALMAMEMK